ncbi:glycosyltransferase, partial [Enterococcus cecorum]
MVQEKLFIQDSLVSIIVPVYNSEKYVERCILSILNQTYSIIELILINDGSTDSSLNILDEYSRKDNRIILVNKENEG